MAKKIKAEIVTPITRAHNAATVSKIMTDLQASAESLAEYIEVFRQANFFQLEKSIVISRKDGKRLLINEHGNLVEGVDDKDIFGEYTYNETPITTIKAASQYDLSSIDDQIAKILAPLSHLASNNKSVLAEKMEHVIMIVNEVKQLTSGRQ